MLHNTQLFLSRVTYTPDKRQITAEFSRKNDKASRKYSFFPKMHLPLEKISRGNLLEALEDYDVRKLKIDFKGNIATIFAATFSDLKKVNNLLNNFFNFRSNLIEPERQFLLGEKWSYFDSFNFSDSEFEKTQTTDFPDVSMDFLSDSLEETVASLLLNNKSLAKETIEKIVFSKLLRIPLMGREEDKSLEEIFTENIFFLSEKPIPIGVPGNNTGLKPVHKKSVIDFSKMISIMASRPFNNLGFETINCSCCKPWGKEAKNILPSSLVRVNFLRESFYFDSVSSNWAEAYHFSNNEMHLREKRKREYFLEVYPSGPFSRNSFGNILLADALKLEQEGLVKIVSQETPSWFCVKKESAFSSEINRLYESLLILDLVVEKESSSVVASEGLFFSQFLESKPGHHYRKTLDKTISRLLSSFPKLLTNSSGRFFNKDFAIGLESINSLVLKDFEEIAKNSQTRVTFKDSTALVDSSSFMSASKEFRDLYRVDKRLLSFSKSF
ncbi:MAG: hypothetical protein NUV57_05430 [archaeon]|nr:hypothetical protein [archaeon]